MPAIGLAKSYVSAFREKPHSSITNWVDILTSSNYKAEAYDGIPELVDSINLQAAGPTEASRAIRKKLKHGNPHQQYRALVILGALVENCGHKFQTTFADGQLTDALRNLASDPATAPDVKTKLLGVLATWHNQFQNDPSMAPVANLYTKHRRISKTSPVRRVEHAQPVDGNEYEKRKKEEKLAKEENKRRAKEAEKMKQSLHSRKAPFDFVKEKPRILSAIATAAQVANNLVNAIMLVNTERDRLLTNDRVQDCLANAKQARKQIVRFIQLVDNEDMIGTLIEANDRLIGAIDTYDKLSKSSASEQDVAEVQKGLASTVLVDPGLPKLQDKQRVAHSARGKNRAFNEHGNQRPDSPEFTFDSLGGSLQSKLPPPLLPSAPRSDEDEAGHRVTLSDYSDYESSDGGHFDVVVASSSTRSRGVHDRGRDLDSPHSLSEDPFADPFADTHSVSLTHHTSVA